MTAAAAAGGPDANTGSEASSERRNGLSHLVSPPRRRPSRAPREGASGALARGRARALRHGAREAAAPPFASPLEHGSDAPSDAARLLAVDLGTRRIGLAVSSGGLALPLATLQRTGDAQAIAAIAEVARREAVAGLVVGEPRRLDGTAGDAARRARTLAARLAAATGLPCRLVDESLTSRAAEERLRQAGIDPRRHPDRVDQVAAQILLEEALAARGGG